MIKRVLILMGLLALTARLPAQDAARAFDAGVTAYQAGKFGEAQDRFNEVNREFGPHAAAYFNAGNAAYSAGLLPQAVLYYEKALELDPNLAVARQNLGLVQAEAQAMTGTLEHGLLPQVTIDQLVVATSVAFWLALIFGVILLGKVLRKRRGVLLNAVCTVVCLAAVMGLGVVGLRKWTQHGSEQIGVVFEPTTAYAEVSGFGAKIADLKPATSVLVKSQRGNYTYARLPNGQFAWLPTSALQPVERRENMASAM